MSWVDGWYLSPSKDHYQDTLYYIPETRAYCISGSTELFPQHCQLPNLTPDQHFCALTEELAEETATANNMPMGHRLIKILQNKITQIQIVEPPALLIEQEVTEQEQRVRIVKRPQQEIQLINVL